MSSMNTDHFTDMDGNAIEDSPEPLPCPFCGSGDDQLIVERWSEEDDPDASYHVECLKCGSKVGCRAESEGLYAAGVR